MEKSKLDFLVTGATGSIGFAVVSELLNQNIPVTILVRSRKKAAKLFNDSPNLEIIEGDVQDARLLKNAASGKRYLFHGVNYPYNLWEYNMENTTRKIIDAAAQNRATILFPANVYNFGNIKAKIFEDTPPNPQTKKGRIRVKLEAMLKEAAEKGGSRVIILRLPDFFGPNVVNGLTVPIFKNALKKKNMQWLIRTDIPHQIVFTADAGHLFVRLAQDNHLPDFAMFNFAGYTVPTMQSFFEAVAKQTGAPAKVRTLPKFFASVLGAFNPVVRELKEMLYLFENSIELNDEKIRKRYPDFQPTRLEEAIAHTLEWFRENVK